MFYSPPLALPLSRKEDQVNLPYYLAQSRILSKMQKKDIEEQLDLLKVAINEKQPADNVINILTKLKADVVPTEDILRVRPLHNLHPDGGVRRHQSTLALI